MDFRHGEVGSALSRVLSKRHLSFIKKLESWFYLVLHLWQDRHRVDGSVFWFYNIMFVVSHAMRDQLLQKFWTEFGSAQITLIFWIFWTMRKPIGPSRWESCSKISNDMRWERSFYCFSKSNLSSQEGNQQFVFTCQLSLVLKAFTNYQKWRITCKPTINVNFNVCDEFGWSSPPQKQTNTQR